MSANPNLPLSDLAQIIQGTLDDVVQEGSPISQRCLDGTMATSAFVVALLKVCKSRALPVQALWIEASSLSSAARARISLSDRQARPKSFAYVSDLIVEVDGVVFSDLHPSQSKALQPKRWESRQACLEGMIAAAVSEASPALPHVDTQGFDEEAYNFPDPVAMQCIHEALDVNLARSRARFLDEKLKDNLLPRPPGPRM